MKKTNKSIFYRVKDSLIKFYIKNKPNNRQDWIRIGILAIAIPIFIYSAGQLGFKLYTYVYEDWRNSQIRDLKPDDNKNPFTEVTGEVKKNEPYEIIYAINDSLNKDGRLPEYETLWQRNNDMAGWFSMPGFAKKPIDYPIMYSGDNRYYVYRDFDKQDSYSGSIFLDGANKPYYSNPLELDHNYVIYGHAMLDKSMFGNVTDYFNNKESWKNNIIYVDFMNTRLEYEVFSTFLISPTYNYRQTKFSSDEEYQKYLDDMMKKSTHDFGIKVTTKDRIVTLSTCYKTTRRTAIIAKLKRQIIYVKGGETPGASVTPIVLPTYIPMNQPSPTPRLTSGASSVSGSSSISKSTSKSSSSSQVSSSSTSSGTSVSSSTNNSLSVSDISSSDISSASDNSSISESAVSSDGTISTESSPVT